MAYAASRTITADEIPVVDISALAGGSLEDARAVAAAIRRAATEIGFFYISGHGVPEPLIERTFRTAGEFFALPREVKLQTPANKQHRGFLSVGEAKMYGKGKSDLKESYVWGLDLPADDPDVLAGKALMGPNQWPAAFPALAPVVEDYFTAVRACGDRVLTAIALSLDLAPDFFLTRYTKPLARGSVIYYPPQPPELGADQFGVAPHTDYGGITLLAQDMNGGLQVRGRDGDWVTAHPIPGTFVVNIGDLLARWTSNLFTSTPHRVINASGRARQSIAVFYDPNFDSVIDGADIPAAYDAPGAKHYDAITTGAYILMRFDEAFRYRQAKAAEAAAAEQAGKAE